MKQQIINILKENKNNIITGSYIASILNITRSYVNKVISSLKDEGYNIANYNRSGYMYIDDIKVLNKDLIYNSLDNKIDVIIFDEIDSTNNYLKRVAKNYNELLCIANKQDSGRGRLGRTFISNKTNGIYMSLLVRPNIKLSDATKITCMSAVAIKDAISDLTNINPLIKWVNDIYISGKKVSGILVESSIEDNNLDYIIIGIGINVYRQKFDESIMNIATSIEHETNIVISRNELISKVINNIYKHINSFYTSDFMNKYIDSSFVIGKDVELNMRGTVIKAHVKGINNNGELIVDTDSEKDKVIYSGEITRMVLHDK